MGASTLGALLVARATLRNWGASKGECRSILPGDELVPDPATTITRAVTVAAPASAVWPWLLQMGQNRGGLYSYDGLENLFGLDIHNADRIHPEWQDLQVGDQVWLVRRGWLGVPDGLPLEVRRIDPGRSLVLYEPPWQAVWSFHLHPHGPGSCRLISRSRAPRATGLARLSGELFDPITLVMTRKMLLGIRDRAERTPVSEAAPETAPEAASTAPAGSPPTTRNGALR